MLYRGKYLAIDKFSKNRPCVKVLINTRIYMYTLLFVRIFISSVN